MAKKRIAHRKEIVHESELRRWTGVRLDPSYRSFFDTYASRFLEKKKVPIRADPFENLQGKAKPAFKKDLKGRIVTKDEWTLRLESSNEFPAAQRKLIKICRKKWGLIRPLPYSLEKPSSRIFMDGAAQVAQSFLSITSSKVFFQIDLSYPVDEIREMFMAELIQLRHSVKEQNKYGFKRKRKGKYTKIVLPLEGKSRNKKIQSLLPWIRAYELKNFDKRKLTNEDIGLRP
jgi:hypothetical protein